MLPKKYHAILFIGILVMLLLLGLHLLGIGYSGGQAAAKSAALARNSSQAQTTSSSTTNINTALSPSQAYRHPIVYDKLTGATNNQINDVLGGKSAQLNDYPIDHYQQQQHQQQQQQQQQHQQLPSNQFNQLPQDDFFNSIHRQGGPPFPPINHHPGPPHHMHPLGPLGAMQIPPPMMTTQTPTLRPQLSAPPPRQLQLGPPPLPPMAPPAPPTPMRPASGSDATSGAAAAGITDSLPSASSLNNNGSQQPSANGTTLLQNQKLPVNLPDQQQPSIYQQQQPSIYQQQQQQQPQGYYTPPIFAYNNFDQNRAMMDPNQMAMPFGFPQQQQQQQTPPLGVPEPPLSIDEYNARQARLRPQQQQQPPHNHQLQPQQPPNEVPQIDRYGKQAPPVSANVEPQFSSNNQQQQQQPNLLADPQQQLRHRQQMLDRNQLLFGGTYNPQQQQLDSNNNQSNYYPDPAIAAGYRPLLTPPPPPQSNQIRPPYAHNMSPPPSELIDQFGNKPIAAQSRANSPPGNSNKLDSNQSPSAKLSVTERPLKMNSLQSGPQQQHQPQQLQVLPVCVRHHQQQQQQLAANETSSSNSTAILLHPILPTLFCNEDPEYPTKDIMRALESYANERSIEQLLPQPLVQIHLNQRTQAENSLPLSTRVGQLVTLDNLQPSIGGSLASKESNSLNGGDLFPSANYESMCRANIYMAQPRRAKNLLGQWKVIVNLPGHKYRGIAISQMLRAEECSRPNTECLGPNLRDLPSPVAPATGGGRLGSTAAPPVAGGGPIALPRSRCLQQYENQRLVAWSHQQGLHVDIFRVPIACSCHIRR